MATLFSHAIAAASLGTALPASPRRARLVVAGALASLLPDVDVLWSGWDGAPDLLAHRGLTHSPCFALLVALALASTRWLGGATRRERFAAAAWLFVATASHGVLDALTDGGEGVAFLAPFSGQRWFLPWRPIAVSPLLVGSVLRAWDDWKPELVLVARTELEWIVVPSLAFVAVVALVRRLRGDAVRRRSAWKPAAALAVVVAALVPIRTIRPTWPPIELSLLLHASDLVVVAHVERIDPLPPDVAAAPMRFESEWISIDELIDHSRHAHARVAETLKGEAPSEIEILVLPRPEELEPDAVAGRTDLFLLDCKVRRASEPASLVVARFALIDVGGRRCVEIPADRVVVPDDAGALELPERDGRQRRALPFEELQRMIAASRESTRSDK